MKAPLLGLALVACSANFATAAQKNCSAGDAEDYLSIPTLREVEVKKDNDKFEVESENKCKGIKDKWEVEMNAKNEYVDIEFNYRFSNRTKSGEAITRSKTSNKFDVRLEKFIEYEPATPGAAYEKGVSKVISEYPQNKWEWLDFVYSGEEGGDSHTANLTTADGVFTVMLYVESDQATSNGKPANGVKFDVIVNSFPYTKEGTMLALQARVQTVEKIKEFEKVPTDSLEVDAEAGDETPTSKFAWVKTYEKKDKTPGNILVSADQGATKGNKAMFFSFSGSETHQDLVWDPEASVAYPPTNSAVHSFGSALLGAVVAAVLRFW